MEVRKRFAPLLRVHLTRVIRSKASSQEDVALARKILNTKRGFRLLAQDVEAFAKDKGKIQELGAAGDHPFLEWLIANGPAIMAFIKQILALFGL